MRNKINILKILRLTKPFNILAKIRSEKFSRPIKDIIFLSKGSRNSDFYIAIIFYQNETLYALYRESLCLFVFWNKNLFLRDFKRFLKNNHKKF